MKIHQLSLFIENKPGHLNAICRTLAAADISIVTLTLADTQQFGILRLIVKDWERAGDVLQKAGFVVNIREVVAMTVPDQPGGLADLLDSISESGVNIEYMYAFTCRFGDQAVMVFRFDDTEKALSALTAAGKSPIAGVDLFKS